MIKSERRFKREMRRMIRRVARGEDVQQNLSAQDCEVLTECIEQGFLLSSSALINGKVVRVQAGTPRPSLNDQAVPLKGLAFLRPDWSSVRSWIALAISVISLAISTLLNYGAIAETIRFLLGIPE